VPCSWLGHARRRFWDHVFNPSGLPVFDEEHQLISESLSQFIRREGLRKPELKLLPGYLTSGNPLHFMLETNQKLHELRQRLAREQREAALRDEL
jgi:hypothetical protein